MADKSPRQHMAKKPTKSIKEKRAEKHAKADAKNHLDLGKTLRTSPGVGVAALDADLDGP